MDASQLNTIFKPNSLECVCCETNIENAWHFFSSCDHAKRIWREANIWHIIEQNWDSADSFKPFLFNISQESHPN